MMNYSINLFQERTILKLDSGKYDLYFLGGYDVLNEGDFIIGLFDLEMTQQIKFEFATRIRSRIGENRGVKYFKFEIENSAEYLLLIQRPNELTIKRSLIWSFNLFQPKVQDSEKMVYIERVYDR